MREGGSSGHAPTQLWGGTIEAEREREKLSNRAPSRGSVIGVERERQRERGDGRGCVPKIDENGERERVGQVCVAGSRRQCKVRLSGTAIQGGAGLHESEGRISLMRERAELSGGEGGSPHASERRGRDRWDTERIGAMRAAGPYERTRLVASRRGWMWAGLWSDTLESLARVVFVIFPSLS